MNTGLDDGFGVENLQTRQVYAQAGLLLIAQRDITAAANIDFANVFLPSYDNYKVVIEGVLAGTTSALQMQYFNAGVIDTGSKYYATTAGVSVNSATTSATLTSESILSTGGGGSVIMDITNVNSAASDKAAMAVSQFQASAGPATYWHNSIGITYTGANAVSGLRLFFASGVFAATGHIKIYAYTN